jgi:hypothetical protein
MGHGLVAGRRAASAVVCLSLLVACSDDGPASSDTTDTSMPRPAEGDLRYLAEQLTTLHPDPFHHVARTEVDERTVDDPADPDQLLVAAMALANLGAGEGHGGVYPWSQPSLRAWPLHLYQFPDGIRVVAGDGVPVGARLLAVGDTPVEEVVAAVRPLVPHDTDWTVRSRLPAYLVFPAVLRGLGFDPTTITWDLPDGETAVLDAPETLVSSEQLRDLLGLFQDQVPPSLPYDRARRFWSEQRGAATYLQWNQVVAQDGDTSLSDLATSIIADVESGRATRVVIDARHNPGGDIGLAQPLEEAVREIEATRPGTVRILVGRGTFSAASYVIARLVEETGVQLVGEPTGGSSRSYADPTLVELPDSGIRAYVNTRSYVTGKGAWEPLEPDIPVDLIWTDWVAGRDPALDAALM